MESTYTQTISDLNDLLLDAIIQKNVYFSEVQELRNKVKELEELLDKATETTEDNTQENTPDTEKEKGE